MCSKPFVQKRALTGRDFKQPLKHWRMILFKDDVISHLLCSLVFPMSLDQLSTYTAACTKVETQIPSNAYEILYIVIHLPKAPQI